MTALSVCPVARKPTLSEAVRFDGTADCGSKILAWIRGICDWSHGHYRPATADQNAALFIPLRFGVLRVDRGDWVILSDKTEFSAYSPASFAKFFEVIP